MTEVEFSDLCNKVILNEKVVIKKITDSSNYNKVENKIDKIEERHILKKIDDYLWVLGCLQGKIACLIICPKINLPDR